MDRTLPLFAEATAGPDPEMDLERVVLLLGSIANDGALDVAACQRELDAIAEKARLAEERLGPSPWGAARAVAVTLFNDLRFRGNRDDYYDPRNSFLHQVIARRLGIPISLSVLYIAVARRLGVTARGVGFPGHFLVRVEGPHGHLLLDPFHGGRALDRADLAELLARRSGAEAKVEPAMLEPISNTALLKRMLFNLSGIYGQRNDWSRSLAVLERLAVLEPRNQRIARELVDLRARMRTLN